MVFATLRIYVIINAMKWIATTGYALEGVTARELKTLGAQDVQAGATRVVFSGGYDTGALANLYLRSAGRVRMVIGEFPAKSFDQLYEGCRALPWEDYLPKGWGFSLSARAVSSTVMSVPDIQSVVSKAVAERLKAKYNLSWITDEKGVAPLEAHLHKDQVVISVDTSGEGLHKRGYRKLNGPAALRETLAASLVLLTKWRGDWPLADPMCGTGTIAVEAAMIGRNMAPGANRRFAADDLPFFDRMALARAREQAKDSVDKRPLDIWAADIDEGALSMAGYHARTAGVGQLVRFAKADVRDFAPAQEKGHIITNPPYGARMASQEEARALYATMGKAFRALPGWSAHIIAQAGDFERWYGGPKAHFHRQVKNGNIDCRYYEYIAGRV